jgi:hypothetical protein
MQTEADDKILIGLEGAGKGVPGGAARLNAGLVKRITIA